MLGRGLRACVQRCGGQGFGGGHCPLAGGVERWCERVALGRRCACGGAMEGLGAGGGEDKVEQRGGRGGLRG